MDDLEWPRVLNRVITQRWSQLKNTLVMKDFVDHLIQKRVVTLDYWISLKTKPITESERTEDFLALVMKFNQQKYQYFLESLLTIHRDDLVNDLLKSQNSKSRSRDNKPAAHGDVKSSGSKRRNTQGQTDADTPLTNPVVVKPSRARNAKDGHNGSQEAFNADRKPARSDSSNPPKVEHSNQMDKAENTQHSNQMDKAETTQSLQSQSLSKMSPTDKLHRGIGTASFPAPKQPNDERRQTKAENEHKNKSTAVDSKTVAVDSKTVAVDSKTAAVDSKTAAVDSKTAAVDSKTAAVDSKTAAVDSKTGKSGKLNKVENTEKLTEETIKDSDCVSSTRPDTAKSKEELLDIREQEINSRESELEKKALMLKKQEEQLKKKETELITRENSLLTNRPTTTESLVSPSKLLRELQLNDGISASSTTESSDGLADVRDQLAAMRKLKEEIESEHTTYCNTPGDEYVKLQDFQESQREIEGLKTDMETDRSNHKAVEQKVENLQQKVEDMNHEISKLQANINKIEREKNEAELRLTEELKKQKTEMKSMQKLHSERIEKMQNHMKAKDNESSELKSNIEDVVKTATDLEERVEILENEKSKQEQQLNMFQKEITFLQKQLEEKESEINDLKKVLEDTENEKEELIEELTELKKDVTMLKSEKRQLEQDKRSLLARCAKPMWSQSTSRRSTFK